jgi:hypothetical protein
MNCNQVTGRYKYLVNSSNKYHSRPRSLCPYGYLFSVKENYSMFKSFANTTCGEKLKSFYIAIKYLLL